MLYFLILVLIFPYVSQDRFLVMSHLLIWFTEDVREKSRHDDYQSCFIVTWFVTCVSEVKVDYILFVCLFFCKVPLSGE